MKRKNVIKVLQVLPSLNLGGTETWLCNLVRMGDPRIHYDFLVQKEGCFYENELKRLGSRVFCLKWSKSCMLFTLLTSAKGFVPLDRFLEERKYDVVHVHYEVFTGDFMKAAAYHNVPVRIAHFHNCGFSGRDTVKNRILMKRCRLIDRMLVKKYATDILACSPEAGEYYMGGYWNDFGSSHALCGIDIDSFRNLKNKSSSNNNLKSHYSIDSNAIVIGHVGSMRRNHIKNHYFLLRVFKELYLRNHLYYLFLAGDGEDYESVQSYAKEIGVFDRVIMPGNCNVPEVMSRLFDVFLFPSLKEGFGQSVVQAVAAGLYVVASDAITKSLTESSLNERIETLSLNSPISTWADHVEVGCNRKQALSEGVELVSNSKFTIQSSSQMLYNIYESKLK